MKSLRSLGLNFKNQFQKDRDSALSQLNSTNQLLENKLAINEAELKELKASLLKAEQQKVKLEGQLESVSHATVTARQISTTD